MQFRVMLRVSTPGPAAQTPEFKPSPECFFCELDLVVLVVLEKGFELPSREHVLGEYFVDLANFLFPFFGTGGFFCNFIPPENEV